MRARLACRPVSWRAGDESRRKQRDRTEPNGRRPEHRAARARRAAVPYLGAGDRRHTKAGTGADATGGAAAIEGAIVMTVRTKINRLAAGGNAEADDINANAADQAA